MVQDLLCQWPAIIVLFATPLSARLPVFFATAWHSASLGTISGHMPSRPLPSYESSSQTEGLSHLRSHPDRPPFGLKRKVSSSTGPSPRHSNGTTLTSRSAAPTTFPSVSRRSPFSSSYGVAPLKRFASQADFSKTVAGHLALCRRNSRLNGQAHEGMFRNWYSIFHYWSSEPSIP